MPTPSKAETGRSPQASSGLASLFAPMERVPVMAGAGGGKYAGVFSGEAAARTPTGGKYKDAFGPSRPAEEAKGPSVWDRAKNRGRQIVDDYKASRGEKREREKKEAEASDENARKFREERGLKLTPTTAPEGEAPREQGKRITDGLTGWLGTSIQTLGRNLPSREQIGKAAGGAARKAGEVAISPVGLFVESAVVGAAAAYGLHDPNIPLVLRYLPYAPVGLDAVAVAVAKGTEGATKLFSALARVSRRERLIKAAERFENWRSGKLDRGLSRIVGLCARAAHSPRVHAVSLGMAAGATMEKAFEAAGVIHPKAPAPDKLPEVREDRRYDRVEEARAVTAQQRVAPAAAEPSQFNYSQYARIVGEPTTAPAAPQPSAGPSEGLGGERHIPQPPGVTRLVEAPPKPVGPEPVVGGEPDFIRPPHVRPPVEAAAPPHPPPPLEQAVTRLPDQAVVTDNRGAWQAFENRLQPAMSTAGLGQGEQNVAIDAYNRVLEPSDIQQTGATINIPPSVDHTAGERMLKVAEDAMSKTEYYKPADDAAANRILDQLHQRGVFGQKFTIEGLRNLATLAKTLMGKGG